MQAAARLAAVSVALLAGGCQPSSFDRSFARSSAAAAEPGQPIAGAWQGTWTNDDRTAGGSARVVVTRRSTAADGIVTDDLAIELADFAGPGAGRRFTAESQFDPRAGPARDFSAKVPAVVIDDLAAAALSLQAHADGDTMTVQYWVSDAVQQIDAGHIDLRRVGPTTRPSRG